MLKFITAAALIAVQAGSLADELSVASPSSGSPRAQVGTVDELADARMRCEQLSKWLNESAVVTRARFIDVPADFGAVVRESTSPPDLRAAKPFCRVQVTITPEPGAQINSEIWLPPRNQWNGRFLGTGNGGAAGAIVYPPLVHGIASGYAVTNSDVGTHSGDARTTPNAFKFGFTPVWRQNYVHRGIHLMTAIGKQIVARYYARSPQASLFSGCSTGGFEALQEAQRYPADYDGILVGNPGLHFAQVGLWQGWSYALTQRRSDTRISEKKLPAIAAAVMQQCDALDGIKDGLIDDPRACPFEPAVLRCRGAESDSCLTSSQVSVLRQLYRGLRNSITGEKIYPGFPAGAELAPGARVRIANDLTGSLINPQMPGPLVWVLGEQWRAERWFQFDFDKDAPSAIERFQPYGADNPDLSAFRERGGKIILYHGWADPNLYAEDLLSYVEAMQAKIGGREQAQTFSRVFIAPGMYHCLGGPGPNTFGQAGPHQKTGPEHDILAALDRWVTYGAAPEQIIATKYADDDSTKAILRTRPLCAYPWRATWNGTGDVDRAENFVCAAPSP